MLYFRCSAFQFGESRPPVGRSAKHVQCESRISICPRSFRAAIILQAQSPNMTKPLCPRVACLRQNIDEKKEKHNKRPTTPPTLPHPIQCVALLLACRVLVYVRLSCFTFPNMPHPSVLLCCLLYSKFARDHLHVHTLNHIHYQQCFPRRYFFCIHFAHLFGTGRRPFLCSHMESRPGWAVINTATSSTDAKTY